MITTDACHDLSIFSAANEIAFNRVDREAKKEIESDRNARTEKVVVDCEGLRAAVSALCARILIVERDSNCGSDRGGLYLVFIDLFSLLLA